MRREIGNRVQSDRYPVFEMRLQDILQGEAKQEKGPLHEVGRMVAMKAVIKLWMDIPVDVRDRISEPMRVESLSSPPGGDVIVNSSQSMEVPWIKMETTDLSTARAMLNSYLGLLSAAYNTASIE